MKNLISKLGIAVIILLAVIACKPETVLKNKTDFSDESLFKQVEEKDLTNLVKRSNKNGLPDPTVAEISAVTTWLDQNQSKMREYMVIWMKGSLKMVQDQQIRNDINKAAHDYEKATGVDFYAPFKDVINDNSSLTVKIEQSLQQYATTEELTKFQNDLKLEYKPFAITIRPKFFLYYKNHNLYHGIKNNKPLRVATAFLQNQDAMPAYEFNGTNWNSITINQADLDERATLLVSPIIEFPDGSTLFINAVEGDGQCARNPDQQPSLTCVVSGKDCMCRSGKILDAKYVY